MSDVDRRSHNMEMWPFTGSLVLQELSNQVKEEGQVVFLSLPLTKDIG